MRIALRCGLGLLLVMFFGSVCVFHAAQDKPKYTIKEVMGDAMKGGLCKKVGGGKASKDDKEKLVELFVALNKNTPPKGEAASWKEKTEALLTAAKELAAGTKGGEAKLQKAANCNACHGAHKQ